MQERIQLLCAELLTATDDGLAQLIAAELRSAINEHLEALREKLRNIPIPSEAKPI